jgi:hypothetical protein
MASIDPATAAAIDTAARRLAGPDAGSRVVARARRLVECCFELERIAAAKDELGQAVLGELDRRPPVGEATAASGSLMAAAVLVERLYRIERYERRAFSALKTAARAFDRVSGDGLTLDALLSKIGETTPTDHDQNLTKQTHAVAPAATGGRDEFDKTNPPRRDQDRARDAELEKRTQAAGDTERGDGDKFG